MSFGRKGLDGAAARSTTSNFGTRASSSDAAPLPPGMANALRRDRGESDMSPELRAFLAAERANRATQEGVQAPSGRIVPDAAPARSGKFAAQQDKPRSIMLAYVLWWFFGGFGAHRFYLGQATSAVIMICTMLGSFAMMFILPPLGLGCFMVWALWLLADAVMIPGMARRYNESLDRPAMVFA